MREFHASRFGNDENEGKTPMNELSAAGRYRLSPPENAVAGAIAIWRALFLNVGDRAREPFRFFAARRPC